MTPRHITHVVLQAGPAPGSAWPGSPAARKAMLEQTKQILQRRAATLDIVGEPAVEIEGGNRLVVDLPELLSERKAVRLLTESGSLEFYYLKDVYTTANPLGQWRMDMSSANTRALIFTGPKGETLDSSKASDEQKILRQVVGSPNVKPVLTGAYLLSNAKASLKAGTSSPIIEIELNAEGTRIFRDFTGAHIGEILAIFYNGRLLTAPMVKDKISDGKAIIEGFPSLKESAGIANLLNAGALPVSLKVVEVRR